MYFYYVSTIICAIVEHGEVLSIGTISRLMNQSRIERTPHEFALDTRKEFDQPKKTHMKIHLSKISAYRSEFEKRVAKSKTIKVSLSKLKSIFIEMDNISNIIWFKDNIHHIKSRIQNNLKPMCKLAEQEMEEYHSYSEYFLFNLTPEEYKTPQKKCNELIESIKKTRITYITIQNNIFTCIQHLIKDFKAFNSEFSLDSTLLMQKTTIDKSVEAYNIINQQLEHIEWRIVEVEVEQTAINLESRVFLESACFIIISNYLIPKYKEIILDKVFFPPISSETLDKGDLLISKCKDILLLIQVRFSNYLTEQNVILSNFFRQVSIEDFFELNVKKYFNIQTQLDSLYSYNRSFESEIKSITDVIKKIKSKTITYRLDVPNVEYILKSANLDYFDLKFKAGLIHFIKISILTFLNSKKSEIHICGVDSNSTPLTQINEYNLTQIKQLEEERKELEENFCIFVDLTKIRILHTWDSFSKLEFLINIYKDLELKRDAHNKESSKGGEKVVVSRDSKIFW